ncbi:hypothetical protein ACFQI7_32635 [Paenibacillus allorhizosphaerae]|uniref:Uncharacterized protein n=1 Tax=Paenibacillus allorhizosphaerae TaxID=2849866 RepID=A0ABM8VU60_9BACL|nr:hypothetical protein [Paenibacillus allorhizosphaerae]CAG7658640.1 hypothetical protein PAECIP111802_07107 [Paenibacillus allorhizosphaerae]
MKINMNKRKVSHWVVVLLLLGVIMQAGVEMASTFQSNALTGPFEEPTASSESGDKEATGTGTSIQVVTAAAVTSGFAVESSDAVSEIVISQTLLDYIKQSDLANYDRNVTNYKSLLAKRDVHPKMKDELERLMMLGHRVPDLLIAYEFLYQAYGQKKDLEAFVLLKESGKAWEGIFQDYGRNHAAFQPRAFDSKELESLTMTAGITSSDIIIADRLAFVSGQPFNDLLRSKVEGGKSWKDVSADLDILNGAGVLPRVQISAEQMNRYTQTAKLTEQQVAEAFVLAGKVEETPEIIIGKKQSGTTPEAIMADYWNRKYNG